MNTRSWRGTVLFTVILVVMGATVGLKLYGVGEQATSAQTSVHAASTSNSSTPTPTPTATSTPTATPTTAAAAPTTTPSASATTVVTGSEIDTRYGIVQVKVTFTGTKITAIDTVQSPSGNGRDIEINQQALPILQQEALSSQSAKIDTVSGATYTSEGYIQSLQSAIDKK